MKKDKVFFILVTDEDVFKKNEDQVFTELILMPLIDQWLKTHEGFTPSA